MPGLCQDIPQSLQARHITCVTPAVFLLVKQTQDLMHPAAIACCTGSASGRCP